MKPRLAWVLGDAAGIGPELVAKGLANDELRKICRPVVVGPRWLLERGMQAAKAKVAAAACQVERMGSGPDGMVPVIDTGWPEQEYPHGVLSAEAGALCIEMLRVAVDLARTGRVDAIVFAPLNKEALHLGGNPHSDELHLLAEWLGDTEVGEINAAAGLFTTRVTSHVPFREVPSLLSPDRVLRAVKMLYTTLRWAGIEPPTVAVAALNPHGGEHGLCGDEELTVIEPGVAKAQALGIPAVGPYPADTIFVRATRGEFHGVVTMYHDQGQIATKLLGFDRGVTIQGGLSIVITTPAHGTAFEIAGEGIANPGAFCEAVRLAVKMAAGRAK
jgi:4-hydroxythreonine-4-phosphate dehydrogenase